MVTIFALLVVLGFVFMVAARSGVPGAWELIAWIFWLVASILWAVGETGIVR